MSPRNNRRLGCCIAAVTVPAIVIGWWYLRGQGSPDRPPVSFDGTSDRLQRTAVVPTLDSPIPEGKNAVWCASFQLAWNRLRDDLAMGPILLTNAQPVADRLNRADRSEDDTGRDAVFAAAGLARDGVSERIRAEMARRFPDAPSPEVDVPPEGAVAYAYLAASARYDYPYFENDDPFPFTDSAGTRTVVGSFGIRKKDAYAYHRLRQQVQVLYCPPESIMREEEVPEFVLDLCKTSQPYQVVLARVDRKPTLADTLADVERKVAAQPADLAAAELHPRDTLLVPNMAWRVIHRFKELEGGDKRFLNPGLQGLYLDTAALAIEFRLDRNGAELASEAKVYVKPGASYFHLNRPFLVYLKRRGGGHPFLVTWIENAELLQGR